VSDQLTLDLEPREPLPRIGHHGHNPPQHRNTDPDTSVQAARSLDPVVVGRQVARAVEAIAQRRCYGATTAELLAALGGDRGNLARRITDARQMGLVVDSGRRRPGPSGRMGAVWVAVATCSEVAA
jgi:hypothetical protein